ncbi:phosphatidate cytidylyltransferase [Saccharibacter sp. 17.LH.SD]|nr:phosphatidate cytidylyltransferase [Saccharibacter sp. 17.LH.SD]
MSNWTELQKRLLSSVVLIPIALFCLWYGRWAYDLLILGVMVGLVWEGENLLNQSMKGVRGFALLLWPLCAGLIAIKGAWLMVFYLGMSGFFFGLRAWIPLFVSIVGGSSLLYLRGRPDGLYETLFVMAVVVASDSTAYAVGRLVGGPKLAPAISPGKTVSGSIGGLLGAALMGGLVAFYAQAYWSLSAFIWGGVIGVAAQAGDLGESAVKRRVGVKDSGTLIPGHGGLLDRFDGLLFAAPLAALLAYRAGHMAFWALGL